MILATKCTVMVEQVPLALELCNTMMRGPPHHRLQDPPSIREWPHGAIANGVAQVVCVARAVTEVVLPVILVQPRSLEEPPIMVGCLNGCLRLRVKDQDISHVGRKLRHVVCQLANLCAQRVTRGGLLAALVERPCCPVLQLAAPDAAKEEVRAAVVVDERRRVDAEAALDVVGLGLERALGLVADGHTHTEDTFLVARGEVEVVFPVLGRGVWGPELFRDPGHVFLLENYAVVCHGPADLFHAEDVVVGHVVLVAIVVVLDVGLTVVGRVDVELAVKDVRRGVGGEDVGYDGRFVGHGCENQQFNMYSSKRAVASVRLRVGIAITYVEGYCPHDETALPCLTAGRSSFSQDCWWGGRAHCC
ncbi:hypothetical protein B5807_04694 [Epicoccum nigrum]|uniref:Uncharacterized protein n=1 Tax=Epicoccum nigrum TaxID=105696 RepID=A0A1Y2M661_EPING|nr:hypothetical protein B5807_04694 [Epicoccum nigrum]